MPDWLTRTLELAGWLAVVPMLGLMLTQWVGFDGRRVVAVLQAMSIIVLAPAAALAVAAALTGRYALALVAVLPLAHLLVMTAPVLWHDDPAPAAAGEPTFTVACANLLASNPTPHEAFATLAATDADVLVLIELTPDLAAQLERALPAGAYPHRAQYLRPNPSGIGVWSRLSFAGGVVDISSRTSIDVMLLVGERSARLVAVHPAPPTFDAAEWSAALADIGRHVSGSDPATLVVGDFNGARWHPSFRNLLRCGWHDTHEVMGRGMSASWPSHRGWLPPPFVRLDHALYGDGLTPRSLHEVEIPGSDHLGFVAEYGFTGPVA